jgi:hypothetical protein
MTKFGDLRLPERFWNKVQTNTSTDCWEWTASLIKSGYGHYRHEGAPRRAHRVAYEVLVGRIPDGLDLDHLCRTRHCVNPAHLEPVTAAENLRRSPLVAEMFAKGASMQASKTHCPKGHEYSPENTRLNRKGGRVCLQCNRAAYRDWAARNRDKERERKLADYYANHDARKETMRAGYRKRKARPKKPRSD